MHQNLQREQKRAEKDKKKKTFMSTVYATNIKQFFEMEHDTDRRHIM